MKLVLVELEKLRTVRKNWLLFAAGVLLPLPIASIALDGSRGFAGSPQDAIDLVALPALFTAAMAVVACAREFEQRTIAVSFMLEPRRERVIAAKAAAAFVLGVAMAALFCAITLGLTAIWLSSSGAPWPWSGAQTAKAVLGAILLTGALGVSGTGFGAVVRHVGGAITLLVIVFFALESIFADRFAFWHDYGVTAAADALIEPATEHRYGFLSALALIAGAALTYLAIGIAVVRRIDV